MDKVKLRKEFNLPDNKNIILFNSFSGIYNERKGWNYFFEAASKLEDKFEIIMLLHFQGQT